MGRERQESDTRIILSNKEALESNAVVVEEGLIVIGSHVQATKNEILKILNNFVRKFQKIIIQQYFT